MTTTTRRSQDSMSGQRRLPPAATHKPGLPPSGPSSARCRTGRTAGSQTSRGPDETATVKARQRQAKWRHYLDCLCSRPLSPLWPDKPGRPSGRLPRRNRGVGGSAPRNPAGQSPSAPLGVPLLFFPACIRNASAARHLGTHRAVAAAGRPIWLSVCKVACPSFATRSRARSSLPKPQPCWCGRMRGVAASSGLCR